MMKSKKGMSLNDLIPAVIVVAVSVIILTIIANIQIGFKETQCTYGYSEAGNYCFNATGGSGNVKGDTWSSNITGEGLTGLSTMAGFYDVLGLVLVAAVVIGVLVGSFMFMKQ